MVATQGCAGGWQHGLMVALPLPSTSHCQGPGLRLGPWQDLGQQELCVVDVSKGGGSEGTASDAVPHRQSRLQQDGGIVAGEVLRFLGAFWASCAP